MDGGVKHRLSNVIAWAGFAAATLVILSVMYWAYMNFAEIPARKAELAELQSVLDSLKQKFEVDPGGIKLIPVEVSATIEEAEQAIASGGRRINRDKRNADEGLIIIGTFGTGVWLLLGLLNYIFFGGFRALPWKRLELAEDEG